MCTKELLLVLIEPQALEVRSHLTLSPEGSTLIAFFMLECHVRVHLKKFAKESLLLAGSQFSEAVKGLL